MGPGDCAYELEVVVVAPARFQEGGKERTGKEAERRDLGVYGLSGIKGLGFRVWGLGFRV